MARVVHQSTYRADFPASYAAYSPVAISEIGSATVEAEGQLTYRSAGTISNLYVEIETNDRGTSTAVSRKNGANGNLSLSIGASATGIFEDNTNVDTIAAGDKVNYLITAGTGGTTFNVDTVSTVFNAVDSTRSRLSLCSSNATTEASVTRYIALGGEMWAGFQNTEANTQYTSSITGTLRNLFVYISANARTATTTVGIRKNTANGNLVVSIGSTATGIFEDTTHSDTIAVNDLVNYYRTTGAGVQSLTIAHLSCELTTTNNTWLAFTGDATDAVDFGSSWFDFFCGAANAFSDEPVYSSKMRITAKVSNLFLKVSANTVNGTTTLTLRKNSANTALTVSVGSTATGVFTDSSNSAFFIPSDNINYAWVSAGSTGALTKPIIAAKVTTAVIKDMLNSGNQFPNYRV